MLPTTGRSRRGARGRTSQQAQHEMPSQLEKAERARWTSSAGTSARTSPELSSRLSRARALRIAAAEQAGLEQSCARPARPAAALLLSRQLAHSLSLTRLEHCAQIPNAKGRGQGQGYKSLLGDEDGSGAHACARERERNERQQGRGERKRGGGRERERTHRGRCTWT